MRRVLHITYHYPPRQPIGAVPTRPGQVPSRLWEAIVLTPQVPGGKRPPGRVIEIGDRDVLQDFRVRFGLNPRLQLHQQLHLPLATKPNSRFLHTKAIDWLKRWLAYPDFTKGWIPFAAEAIAEFAKHEQVDAVLTTSPPESCHIIGAQAKKSLPGIPLAWPELRAVRQLGAALPYCRTQQPLAHQEQIHQSASHKQTVGDSTRPQRLSHR